LLRLPRPLVTSEAATHAPSDSFQMDLYEVFIAFAAVLREEKGKGGKAIDEARRPVGTSGADAGARTSVTQCGGAELA
jgi:hypothetical protein